MESTKGILNSPTRETYKDWQMAYSHFNQELFDGQLPECLITYQREKNTAGYFTTARFSKSDGVKTDEIALNPSCFALSSIRENLSTLLHECKHIYGRSISVNLVEGDIITSSGQINLSQ
jgi:hypothetical protein